MRDKFSSELKQGTYFCVVGIGILLLAIAILCQGPRQFTPTPGVTVRPTNYTQAGALPMPVAPGRRVPYRHGNIAKPRIVEAYGRLPMAFEANRGQTDGRVKFLSRGRGYSMFLTAHEAVLALQPASKAQAQAQPSVWGNTELGDAGAAILAVAWSGGKSKTDQVAAGSSSAPAVLRMKLVGANRASRVDGLQELPGKSTYFIGNDPKKWNRNVPTYAQVRYKDAYPGIDLIYYGKRGQLEYDFLVAPGASPKAITLAISSTGDKPLRINEAGDLVATLDGGQVDFHKPAVYQRSGVERTYVDGRYVLKGQHEVGFEIASYDHRQALVIDPTLSYSTYLGGTNADYGYGIAVDSVGNAYLTGDTLSTDFPTSNPLQPTNHGGYDAFVAVLDPAGATLLYSTYLGGSRGDVGQGIAVDSAGNAYVTGYTTSTDFPTVNALQPTYHGEYSNAFVAALDATGSTLLYSTYLGGSVQDIGQGIAVDGAGNAYVTGRTASTDFPTSNPLQPMNHGGYDAFVAALDPTGALLYSTYLGGSQNDFGEAIAVDSVGNAYVTGGANSTDFPTSNPLQPTNHGSEDAFVAALDPTGATLLYSTYLGGSSADVGYGIAVDSTGNAYVTGNTGSTDFPTSNPLQPTNHGSGDAFVAALDPTGATLLYSTYLGGTGRDEGLGIAVDGVGNAYVTGYTTSTDFPTSNPLQPTNHGGYDSFVAALDATGSTLLYSTYLGGSGIDFGNAIAVDSAGNAYVTGYTTSTDFPTVNALQPTYNGGYDAFVTKIAP